MGSADWKTIRVLQLILKKKEKMDLIGLEQCPMAGTFLCSNKGASPDI